MIRKLLKYGLGKFQTSVNISVIQRQIILSKHETRETWVSIIESTETLTFPQQRHFSTASGSGRKNDGESQRLKCSQHSSTYLSINTYYVILLSLPHICQSNQLSFSQIFCTCLMNYHHRPFFLNFSFLHSIIYTMIECVVLFCSSFLVVVSVTHPEH